MWKKLQTKENLKVHTRAHRRETCQQCGKSFTQKVSLTFIWKFTLERPLTPVNSVEIASLRKEALKSTWGFTPERNPTPAECVEDASFEEKTLKATWEFTPERNPSPVNSVERASHREEIFPLTWEYTPEKSQSFVFSVAAVSEVKQTLMCTWRNTLETCFKFHQCGSRFRYRWHLTPETNLSLALSLETFALAPRGSASSTDSTHPLTWKLCRFFHKSTRTLVSNTIAINTCQKSWNALKNVPWKNFCK